MPMTVSPWAAWNSSSSPAIAPSRPYTRAMPSPACSTVPVSITATFWSYCSICLRMISLISSARMSISSLLRQKLLPRQLELRADASVVENVSHLRHQPANQRRVLAALENHLLAQPLLDGPAQRQREVFVERARRGHGRAHAARLLVDQRRHLARHVGKLADAPAIHEQHEEIAHFL